MGYGTFRVRRAFPRRYYYRVSSSFARAMESPLTRRIAACLVIFTFVFLVTKIPVWPATRLAGFFKWAFTSDSDLTPVLALIRRAAEGISSAGSRAFPVTAPPVRMTWPVTGKLITAYGWRVDPTTKKETLHEGIDIAVPAGTPVRAAAAGVVVNVRESSAYEMIVEVDHGRGLKTTYANCSEVSVAPRTRVEQGDVIAKVGTPADGTGPHLHFEVLVEGGRVDP
ncbi:MAG: M23 family metallopeptidase, partial [Firmicutes bacterium]|nr:M23 family metallopeptidase [Bacillota bacterium]